MLRTLFIRLQTLTLWLDAQLPFFDLELLMYGGLNLFLAG